MALEIEGLSAGYGAITVLRDVSFTVRPKRTTALIGPNGVGKTTLVGALIGQVQSTGRIGLDGDDIRRLPTDKRIRRGLGYVPDTRGVFGGLTVRENIVSAARASERDAMWEELSTTFPVLKEKEGSKAGQLSGGQQQLVSIARALAGRPRYVLLDEPSIGLSPVAIQGVVDALQSLSSLEVGVLLAEQNSTLALRVAHEVIVLGGGGILWSGEPEGLRDSEKLARLYLGSPDSEENNS